MNHDLIDAKRRAFLGASTLVLAGAMIGAPTMADATPSAETNPQNPFGLVYRGALTENAPGAVNIHPVRYKLNGLDIAANVYTPANFDPGSKYPAIVIAHPNGGVKEQVAGLFAQRLAEQGYVTIAMDAAYQGASGGAPRNTDKPQYRTEDIHGAADFITNHAGVDAQRLGLLGICGGGGYSLAAAKADKRFKSVATLSMFNSGRVRRNGFEDSQLNTIEERLRQASAARAQEAAGGRVLYVGGGAAATDEQIAAMPFEMYREGAIYYERTHAHPNSGAAPNSGGTYTVSSLMDLMRWDATDQIELIDQPLLMIAGGRADSSYMTDDAFAKATGTTDKELFKVEGATHIETYWVPEYVDAEVGKLTPFFARTVSNRPT